jgi:hypothetical protein
VWELGRPYEVFPVRKLMLWMGLKDIGHMILSVPLFQSRKVRAGHGYGLGYD